jgi:selenocysteine lyase/cysteine desulfurase
LYVRKDRIAGTWPLQAAPERRDNDIRKFEEIGTSPAATKAAINEAIAFQQAIGIERKAARLRYLTLRWANELKKNPKIKLHSSLDAGQTWGLAVVSIEGVDSNALVTHLWDAYRIVIVAVGHDNPKTPAFSYRGLRVTPNIYTPLEEIDTFVAAMQAVAKNGLPTRIG